MAKRQVAIFTAWAGLLAVSAHAGASVKDGVDAWSKGNYTAAVSEWRGPADAGDPDAQFNMAQAYRLGRGVKVDESRAREYYEKAAAQGHLKAADNYGLLLFQQGDRETALPFIRAAADRGDPRAQYLLGIAHFNGELVEKDWVRAYALLTLANAAGLPQAAGALQQMDGYIPLEQRQMAQLKAAEIKQTTDTNRAQQLAALDLATGASAPAEKSLSQSRILPQSSAAERPAPIVRQAVPPSVTRNSDPVNVAQAAVAAAERADGTQSPATAGADFARPAVQRPAMAASAPVQARQASPSNTAPKMAATGGDWRIQLGAFGVSGNAERLWAKLSGKPALRGAKKITEPAGRLTKLYAGGYGSRAEADTACRALKSGGQDCLVTSG